MSIKEPRGVWSEGETLFYLSLIKQHEIVAELRERKNRNADVYRKLVPYMRDAGFCRTLEQLRVKWKHLQVVYRKANDPNSAISRNNCPFYDEIEEMILSGQNENPLEKACDSLPSDLTENEKVDLKPVYIKNKPNRLSNIVIGQSSSTLSLPHVPKHKKTVTCEPDHEFYVKHMRASSSTTTTEPNNGAQMKGVMDALASISAEKQSDRFDHFGTIVADQLRNNVSGFNRELAQVEIQQVLIKYHKDNPITNTENTTTN